MMSAGGMFRCQYFVLTCHRSKICTRYFSIQNILQKEKKRRFEALGYVLLAIPVATFCLGTWQVRRRQWKLNLIKSMEEKLWATPIPFPEDTSELQNLEYKRVKVKGVFDHSKEILFGPRTLTNTSNNEGGGLISSMKTGWHVVTPFHLTDHNKTILIDRGWVSQKNQSPLSRKSGQILDEVELTGIVRLMEKRAPFIPKNAPHLKLWYFRDLEEMGKWCETEPIMLDADRDSTVEGGPIGGQTQVTIRNEHFSYIVTWYGLSALTSYMWYRKFIYSTSILK